MALVAINLWVGLRLLFAIDAFAWKLTVEMAITYGWALLGAAVLAFFARLEPYWENQWPLFAALVAYDLVLAGPLCYLLINPTLVPSVPYRTATYLAFVVGSLIAVICFSLYYKARKSR